MMKDLDVKFFERTKVGLYTIAPYFRYSYSGNSMLICRENGCTFFCTDKIASSIENSDISQGLGLKLISRGFVSVPGSLPQVINKDCIEPRFFLIDLTNGCNLDCSYCFRVSEQNRKVISPDQVQKICSYIFQYCEKHQIKAITIQPWGGEPLLCIDRIVQIRRFFDNHKKIAVDISVETNGTLLTEENLRILKDNRIRISISVDGPPSIHDAQRRSRNGQPTADIIKENIKTAEKYGYERLSGICILTRNSIGQIKDILRYMSEDLRMSSIKLNLMRQPAYECVGVEPLAENQIPDMVAEIMDAVSELRQNEIRFTEANIRDRLMNLAGKRNNNICNSMGCCGGRKMISFDMDGNIYPCELTDWPDECMGSIYDCRDLSEMIKEAIVCKPYFQEKHVEECNTCAFWFYCQGGCSSSIKYKKLQAPCIDSVECSLNKALYPMLIKKILNRDVEKEGWI